MSTQLARALLNPMRIRILDAVAEEPASPRQLAADLEESVGVVAYHVGVMRTTGSLRPLRSARPGGGDHCVYELTPLAAPARRRISQRGLLPPSPGHPSVGALRALVDHDLAGLEAPGDRREDRLGCMSIALDRVGMQQVSATIASALDQVSTAQAESARRLADTGEEPIEATIALANFRSRSGTEARA